MAASGGGPVLQSARIRYFSNQVNHAKVVSNEMNMLLDKDDVGRGNKSVSRTRRHPKINVEASYTSEGAQSVTRGDTSIKSKISSARNLSLRNSLMQVKPEGVDAMTPVLMPNDQAKQAVSSQQLLYDMHSTKGVGIAVSGGPAQVRHRSEHVSKVRQRPPATDVINPQSISSCGGEDARSSMVAIAVPAQHQGRLLFKRQERNAGKPSQALHQVSQRQLLGPNVAAYYPAQDVAYQGGTSSTISFHQEMLAPDQQNQQQQNSSDQNSNNSGHQQQHPAGFSSARLVKITKQGYMLGEQKKAALRAQQNYLVLASPRSDKNHLSRHSKKVEAKSSAQELKATTKASAETSFKSNRSLRRVSQPNIINKQEVASWSLSGGTKLPSKLLRVSNSIGDRANQILTVNGSNSDTNLSNTMMNIKDESSALKQNIEIDDNNNRSKKFPPTRQSIPIESTKHFLENEGDHGSGDPQYNQVAVSEHEAKQNSSNGVQGGGHLLSFEARSNSILGHHPKKKSIKQQQQYESNRQGSGSALHQHSSSVLPSQRHRQLLSSVNKMPSGVSSENLSQLQHYGSTTEKPAQQVERQLGADEVYQSVAVLQRQNSKHPQYQENNGVSSQSRAQNHQQKQNARAQYKHLRQQVASASQDELGTKPMDVEITNSVFVSKVQQKNQQFKFQFRLNKNHQAKQQQKCERKSAEELKALGSIRNNHAAPFVKVNGQSNAKQSLSSHRVSAPAKARPIFHVQQPNSVREGVIYADDELVNVGNTGNMHDEQHQTSNRRDYKLLSSESPPQSKRSGLQHVKQFHRGSKKYPAEGGDFSNLTENVISRARIQSVAIKPNSLSKKDSDAKINEKLITTSSQNSGKNTSGLNQMQKKSGGSANFGASATGSEGESNTITVLNFNSKVQATVSREEQDQTTQKMMPRKNSFYENMVTKKRNTLTNSKIELETVEANSTAGNSRAVHTRVHSHQWVQRNTAGVTISQEESVSDGIQKQLPSIKNGRQNNRNFKKMVNEQSNTVKHSRELSHGFSHAFESATASKVTNYNHQNPSTSYASRVDSSERNFVIKASSMQSASLQVNHHATCTSRYDDSSQKFDRMQTNHGQGGETASNQDSAGNGNMDSAFKGSLASGAGSTAEHYNDPESEIRPKNGLSQTSSMNKFQHAYQIKSQSTAFQGSNSKFKVEVYSDKHSANEIQRLQKQIKERDNAYSSLKTQFEQLRMKVDENTDKKQGNSIEFDEISGPIILKNDSDSSSASMLVRKVGIGIINRQKVNVGQNKASKTDLNGLQLIKQRSNSEAHLLHFAAPLGTINEQSTNLNVNSGEILRKKVTKITPGLHRTPTQRHSRLKQPTKFIGNPTSKMGSGVIISERSAPKINQLMGRQKTSEAQVFQPASQSPGRKNVRLSARRISQPSNRYNTNCPSKHTGSEVQLSMGADMRKSKVIVSKFGQIIGSSKAAIIKHQQFRQDPTLDKIKGQTEVQSTVSLEKDATPQASASRKKLQKMVEAQVKQKQPVSKNKTKQPNTKGIEFMDKIGGISKKVAIQNLKQAINTNHSTGKKSGSKHRSSASQSKAQATTVTNKSVQPSIFEAEPDTQSQLRINPDQRTKQNRFVCAGAQQQTIDIDLMQEQILKRQESLNKEETPSNEQSQSQNSYSHPTSNIQAGKQPVGDSSDFKVTGTAFGQNIDNAKLGKPQPAKAPAPAQVKLVNVFGLPLEASDSSAAGDASEHSAAFPRHSDLSQSATFVGQDDDKKSISVTAGPQTAQLAHLSSLEPIDSRCDTPIHPNQVVDGIKFMDVQDPNYISSAVFEQCQDDSPEKPSQVQLQAAPSAQVQNAMNSTGKEFFAVKKQGQVQVQPQPQAQSVALATIAKKTQIEILKQLQKRKQGANGGQTQPRKASHPKVVQNPFAVASQNNRSKQTTMTISQSQASTNNFVSSVELGTAAIQQHQQFTISSQANNRSSEHNEPTSGFGGFKSSAEVVIVDNSSLREKTPTLNASKHQEKITPPSKLQSFEQNINKSKIKPTAQAHLKNQLSSVSRNNEANSMVSAELFYSPMHVSGDEDDGMDDDDHNIEILPQFSNKNKTGMVVYERRQSEACTRFGKQVRNFEESSFQVSQIELGLGESDKRDEILDDSLLLALQEDNPKGPSYLNDSSQELLDARVIDCSEFNKVGNADLVEPHEKDHMLFAQQQAVQYNGNNMTPINEYSEQSNMRDIISTGSNGKIGEGLHLLEQRLSNLSSEMAHHQGDPSPDLKKQRLNSHAHINAFDIELVDADVVNDNTAAKNNGGTIQFTLTDKKELPVSNLTSQIKLVSRNMAISSVGSGSGQQIQCGTANKIANSGSKFTLTDKVLSKANLTYSDDEQQSSTCGNPHNVAASQASVSAWTATGKQQTSTKEKK